MKNNELVAAYNRGWHDAAEYYHKQMQRLLDYC